MRTRPALGHAHRGRASASLTSIQGAVGRWLVPAGLVALVLVAYAPALSGDFVNIDDTHYLSRNRAITATTSPIHFWIHPPDNDFWWPVTYSSLWLLWHASSGRPVAFHLANALLHALNATLLYFLLGRYSERCAGRLAAAALFAVHPVHATAVAWIFQHKTVLSTALFLLAFGAYQRSDGSARTLQARRGYHAASVALFALAALAKSSTIMLPLCLILHHILTRSRNENDKPEASALKRIVGRLSAHLAVAVVLASLTALVNAEFLDSGRLTGVFWHPGVLERLLVSAKNFWFYLRKLVPTGYAFVYPWENSDPHKALDYLPLATALLATGVMGFGVRRWRSLWPVAVGLAFYALNLAPALGFASTPYMRYSLVADHYQYLASLGVFPLAGLGLSELTTRLPWRPVRNAFFVGVVLGSTLWTRARARTFENSETLWRAAIADNPNSDLAYYNLGVYLGEQRRTAEAVELYQRTLVINPKKVEARVNLGKVMLERGDLAGAEAEYLAALEADPKWPSALYGLGVVRQNQSRFAEALEAYDRALAVKPRLADAWSNKCLILVETARYREGEEACGQALAVEPLHRAALTNRAVLLVRTQRLGEALSAYQRLLELDAVNPKLHLKVAALAGRTGNRELARSELQRTLELDPHNVEAAQLLHQLNPQ